MKSTRISDISKSTVASSIRRGGGEMMKKLIVLGVVAAMIMGLAVVASAAVDSYWIVQMRPSDPAGSGSGGTITLGTRSGYSDGYAPVEDVPAPPPVTTNCELTPIDLGDAVNAGGRWLKDQRAPLNPGDTKIWNLRLYGNSAWGTRDFLVKAWIPVAAKIDPSTEGDPDLVVQLKMGDTVLYTFAVGSSGTSAAPNWSYTFPYRAEGYDLQLVASAPLIPEPGSILALASGLVGLVGFGIRRRK